MPAKTTKPAAAELPSYDIQTLRAGGTGRTIRITAGDETFQVPPVELWPDEALEALPDAGETLSPKVIVRLARGLLGDEYEAYRAAGGRAMDIMSALNADAAAQGLELGE
jgi:hypothetical protein